MAIALSYIASSVGNLRLKLRTKMINKILFKYHYNPLINFRAILSTILCHVVQQVSTTQQPQLYLHIFPPAISAEKKQSQRKITNVRVLPFHRYYFTWKKTNAFGGVQ